MLQITQKIHLLAVQEEGRERRARLEGALAQARGIFGL